MEKTKNDENGSKVKETKGTIFFFFSFPKHLTGSYIYNFKVGKSVLLSMHPKSYFPSLRGISIPDYKQILKAQ